MRRVPKIGFWPSRKMLSTATECVFFEIIFIIYIDFYYFKTFIYTSSIGDGILDGIGKVVHVLGSDTSHTDSAVGDEVNVPFIDQDFTLLLGEASVGEHTNLFGDVVPVALGAVFNQGRFEEVTHVDNALGHSFQFILEINKN